MHAPKDQKTKVLHMTSVHNRYDVRIFHKECRSLKDAGYDVHLVVADGLGDEERFGVKIHDVGKPESLKDRILRKTCAVYKKAREINPSLYHYHDPELMFAGIRLRLSGKTVIYDIHEDLPKQIKNKSYIPVPMRWLLSIFAGFLVQSVSHTMSANITVTEYLMKRFPQKKTALVMNYPRKSETPEIKTEWTSRNFDVTYVGGVNESRGFFNILNAVQKVRATRHPHLRVAIIGPQDKAVETYLAENPQSDWLYMPGCVDRDGVWDILSNTKIGIHIPHRTPQRVTGNPTKVYEYMFAGLPFILSDFENYKAIAAPASCALFFDPEDENGIAEGIRKLLSRPEKTIQMGLNGKQYAHDHFTWEEQEQNLFDLYNRLLTA